MKFFATKMRFLAIKMRFFAIKMRLTAAAKWLETCRVFWEKFKTLKQFYFLTIARSLRIENHNWTAESEKRFLCCKNGFISVACGQGMQVMSCMTNSSFAVARWPLFCNLMKSTTVLGRNSRNVRVIRGEDLFFLREHHDFRTKIGLCLFIFTKNFFCYP